MGKCGLPLAEQLAHLDNEPFELPRVDGAGIKAQRVSRGLGDEKAGRGAGRPVRFKGPAQLGDERLHGGEGLLGRLGGPEVIDEPVDRDDPAAGDRQAGEDLAMPGPAQAQSYRGGRRYRISDGTELRGPVTHGYVVRRPDPSDRRAKLVILTDQGREVFTIAQELAPEIEAEIDRLVGPERAAALRADLERIRHAEPPS